MPVEIVQIEVGQMQNFNELVADVATGRCAVVDPAFEVDRLLGYARERGWTIDTILVTHTHHDHIEGLGAMHRATGATIYVGRAERARIEDCCPGARIVALDGGEGIALGASTIEAIATPGHTAAGMSYRAGGAVMTGDTLFVGGCGRTDFQGGDAATLWHSLQRLAALPEETRVYPGHDYGQTVTSTIGWELATNPYLRCASEAEFVALRTGGSAPRPIRGAR